MATIQKLNELLSSNGRKQEVGGYSYLKTIPAVTCASGLRLSVQASRTHYCEPRIDDGPWSKVEVGFPTSRVEALMEYAEDSERPTETVYGYVPIEVVAKVIDDNGGIAS